MTIDISVKGVYVITEYNFVKKMHNNLDKGFKGLYQNTLATDFLFKVDKMVELLSKYNQEEYHKTIAKLIWASQCSRPDLQPLVVFYSTRVEVLRYMIKKLKHTIGYL